MRGSNRCRLDPSPSRCLILGAVAGTMFGTFQGFVSPEAFSLQESVLVVAMVVFGGIGHIRGVVLGAVALTALPEVLRYVVGPLQDRGATRCRHPAPAHRRAGNDRHHAPCCFARAASGPRRSTASRCRHVARDGIRRDRNRDSLLACVFKSP
jgi:hypothetical protein